MESNDSPEIPDRGETLDIPGLPSGGEGRQREKEQRSNDRYRTKHTFIITHNYRNERVHDIVTASLSSVSNIILLFLFIMGDETSLTFLVKARSHNVSFAFHLPVINPSFSVSLFVFPAQTRRCFPDKYGSLWTQVVWPIQACGCDDG